MPREEWGRGWDIMTGFTFETALEVQAIQCGSNMFKF